MSARKAWNVCPIGFRKKARYRNRKAAIGGLDTVRQECRRSGMPAEVWPVRVYRCPPRDDGGCGGWHLASDRRAVEEHLGGLNGRRLILLPTFGEIPDLAEHHVTAVTAA